MSRVLVALSGGVDSSVAAALLLEAGHEVAGVTMRLWGGAGDSGCCSVSDVDDARRVAQQLDIDFHVFNFSDDFDRHVVDPYVAEHAAGRTPNPCIECNRHLKFDRLLRRAQELGFEAVATGHHARVVEDGARLRVARGADSMKDQSYVLSMLTQPVLERVLLPVGELTKQEVRVRAAALGLRTAAKDDSQDVCFITTTEGRAGFLAGRMTTNPGRLVDTDGAEVGRVEAIELLTIGQRKGLGLEGGPAPRYVVGIEHGAGVATVGPAAALETSSLELRDVVWSAEPIEGALSAQCAAHGAPRPATVTEVSPGRVGTEGSGAAEGDGGRPDRRWLEAGGLDGTGRVRLEWATPQRRVAPGQSVALYDGDLVVGGGIAC